MPLLTVQALRLQERALCNCKAKAYHAILVRCKPSIGTLLKVFCLYPICPLLPLMKHSHQPLQVMADTDDCTDSVTKRLRLLQPTLTFIHSIVNTAILTTL